MTEWNTTMADGAIMACMAQALDKAGLLDKAVEGMSVQLCQFLAGQRHALGCEGGSLRKLHDLAVAKAKVQP